MWSNVKDSPPKKKGYYLIAVASYSKGPSDQETFGISREIARWDGTNFRLGGFVFTPTHWMSTFEDELCELLKEEYANCEDSPQGNRGSASPLDKI